MKTTGVEQPKNLLTIQRRCSVIMQRFAQKNPSPRCELFFRTPFQLLVSVVLSAQTTDKAVNRCMQTLYEQGLCIDDVLAMGVEGFLEHIRSIGLAPSKARYVVGLSKQLKERHHSEIPQSYEDLIQLPGVGRKTALVVLAELFQHPTLAVDTHVFRVGKRLGLHCADHVLAAEKQLLACISKSYLPQAHHWFILHGRYICSARSPKCGECFLADVCPSVLE
ncbi:MAG: endonuclease III [Proteobacteria bacterium]|nr:endonuclease III [Pseudomonadota bacterium]